MKRELEGDEEGGWKKEEQFDKQVLRPETTNAQNSNTSENRP